MKIAQFSATRAILADVQIPSDGSFALVTSDSAKMPFRMAGVETTTNATTETSRWDARASSIGATWTPIAYNASTQWRVRFNQHQNFSSKILLVQKFFFLKEPKNPKKNKNRVVLVVFVEKNFRLNGFPTKSIFDDKFRWRV